jgi:hypothetical protein
MLETHEQLTSAASFSTVRRGNQKTCLSNNLNRFVLLHVISVVENQIDARDNTRFVGRQEDWKRFTSPLACAETSAGQAGGMDQSTWVYMSGLRRHLGTHKRVCSP